MQRSRLSEVSGVDVSRETWGLIETYMAMLLDENEKQNLIARSTEAELFGRHILDSAQLLRIAEVSGGSWVDIGSGPGLPGIVLALLAPGPFTLVEPRPLRVQFLERCIETLRLAGKVSVVQGKASAVEGAFDIITGRAVANLHRFLTLSHHLSTEKSLWVLPKGKKAPLELEEARRFWHLEASVVPSATDPDAAIVRIARATPRKRGGKR